MFIICVGSEKMGVKGISLWAILIKERRSDSGVKKNLSSSAMLSNLKK